MNSDSGGPWPLHIPGLDQALRMRVHADADVFISESIRQRGIWEPYETSLVQKFLLPGQVFLDAGANIGYFSLVAAACVGEQGRVLAFEPEPRNHALLNANIELNAFGERVASWALALGAEPGRARLHLHPDNLGDHQLHNAGAVREQIDIEVADASVLQSSGVGRVDFVKIDTQGAESDVVRGLLPLLRASGPDLKLLVELTPLSLRQAGSSGEELLSLLASLDLPFTIVDHIEHRLVATPHAELVQWCKNVDGVPGDEGFMNIFVGATL